MEPVKPISHNDSGHIICTSAANNKSKRQIIVGLHNFGVSSLQNQRIDMLKKWASKTCLNVSQGLILHL